MASGNREFRGFQALGLTGTCRRPCAVWSTHRAVTVPGSRPRLANAWTSHARLPGLSFSGVQPCTASMFPPGLGHELIRYVDGPRAPSGCSCPHGGGRCHP